MRISRVIRVCAVIAIASSGMLACAPASDARQIGPAGGTVTLHSGPAIGASVLVPPNALSNTITITIAEGSTATDLPTGARATGPVVVFGPEGQTFAQPVLLTLPSSAEARVVYTRAVGGSTWTMLAGAQYDAMVTAVHIETTHFSEFVPGVPPPCTLSVECDTGYICLTGMCVPGGGGCTDRTLTPCRGACVNTSNDAANCGGCAIACPTGSRCSSGVCTGTCTTNADCSTGQVCMAGTCTASTCGTGLTACGTACVNLSSDPNHCGTCATTCTDPLVCSMGACAASCATGLTDCMGACVDLMTDATNCGACNLACTTGMTCMSGVCR